MPSKISKAGAKRNTYSRSKFGRNCWAISKKPDAISSREKATVPTRRTFLGGSCAGAAVLISSIV
ncbi:twin-arginine translocation signal domain-containing protein [uncultured Gemmiger sp.]|uniref:twin-arginine translocation signal domain-containing protein n=1 Tax=uncultured Gemmiger sp. TaxID=1623490 RepID=UPI00345D5484